LFGLVALCRVVPGSVFVAAVACGWTRVTFGRFAVASLLVSALYLPLMLYLVIVFGDALDDHAGLWTWPFLLCVVVMAGFMRHRVFSLGANIPIADAGAVLPPKRQPRLGPAFSQLMQVQRAWNLVPRVARRLGLF
jgi:hypothetical protein